MDNPIDSPKFNQVFSDQPHAFVERGAAPLGRPLVSTDALNQLQHEAELGDSDAQLKLSLAYSRGMDVLRERDVAKQWLMASANGGNPQAQYFLGISYMVGAGLEMDLVKARHWLESSRSQGIEVAGKALEKLNSMPQP